jgi:uncharacterized membrane protein YeaQ/YmgE (transglycosylase-associated protein family)
VERRFRVPDGPLRANVSVQRQSKEYTMSILAWLVLGLIAGFIGSKIVNNTGEGLFIDIALGIIGAVVGGFLFTAFGAAPVTGLNIYSLIVAVIGSIVVLWIYHAVVGRGRTRI